MIKFLRENDAKKELWPLKGRSKLENEETTENWSTQGSELGKKNVGIFPTWY